MLHDMILLAARSRASRASRWDGGKPLGSRKHSLKSVAFSPALLKAGQGVPARIAMMVMEGDGGLP